MFKFSIRDLLWLTVVVALVLGWQIERHRTAVRESLAKDNIARSQYISNVPPPAEYFTRRIEFGIPY